MSPDQNRKTPLLTGGRQTMLSWARVIESYAALPEVYQDPCNSALGDLQPFPHVVLVPAIYGLHHRITEKLLCEVDDTFYVWEHVDNRILTTEHPLEAIRDLEMGLILLYSWVTVSSVASEGTVISSTIEFNTATARHIMPFVSKMRPALNGSTETGLRVEQDKFDYLTAQNFKFMNYARDSLVRGEKVIDSIWQPKIRTQVDTLLGWPIYRTTTLAHLAILTNKEVIFIGDDERSVEQKGARYGGMWQYVPLRSIVTVSMAEQAGGLLLLSLHLSPDDRQIDKVFAASRMREVEHFQVELRKLIK